MCAGEVLAAWPENVQKVAPDAPVDGGLFGTGLALHGDTLVVTPFHGTTIAYVFERNLGGWQMQQELKTSDLRDVYHFSNRTVATDASTIVVADYDHSYSTPGGPTTGLAGALYVFEETPSGWTETALLGEESPYWQRYLGRSVAVSGDTILAGSNAPPGTAPVQVFQRMAGTWQFSSTLQPSLLSQGGSYGGFGLNDIVIEDNVALIGASGYTQNGGLQNAGAVFVYENDGSAWQESAVILPEDPAFRGGFGSAIDISDGRAIIGRPGSYPLANGYPGAAYIFEKINGIWTQTAELIPSDPFTFDFFGEDVAISGDMAAVAARGGDEPAVYLFQRSDNGSWNEIQRITTGLPSNADQFASALGFDEDYLAIGARGDDEFGIDAGAVHVYTIPEPATSLMFLAPLSLIITGWVLTRRQG